MPKDIFKGARVLDVGCNEGWVTCEIGMHVTFIFRRICLTLTYSVNQIAHSWEAREVVGVDIDDTLVRAAWKRRRAVWSQRPSSLAQPEIRELSVGNDSGISFTHPGAARDEELVAEGSFPAAFEHMFGPLPIPPADAKTAYAFPHNVSFRAVDWVNDGAIEDRDGYDVVLG